MKNCELLQDTINQLKSKYKKSTLTKSELAQELGIGLSTINYYLARGINLPNYKKLSGNGNGGKVLFPIQELALFLSQTTKVA